jgi:hypothetical protein
MAAYSALQWTNVKTLKGSKNWTKLYNVDSRITRLRVDWLLSRMCVM